MGCTSELRLAQTDRTTTIQTALWKESYPGGTLNFAVLIDAPTMIQHSQAMCEWNNKSPNIDNESKIPAT